MLWLVIDSTKSETISSCNTFNNNGIYELWITKMNGKTMKVRESENPDEIQDYKLAIDYAIANRETVFYL